MQNTARLSLLFYLAWLFLFNFAAKRGEEWWFCCQQCRDINIFQFTLSLFAFLAAVSMTHFIKILNWFECFDKSYFPEVAISTIAHFLKVIHWFPGFCTGARTFVWGRTLTNLLGSENLRWRTISFPTRLELFIFLHFYGEWIFQTTFPLLIKSGRILGQRWVEGCFEERFLCDVGWNQLFTAPLIQSTIMCACEGKIREKNVLNNERKNRGERNTTITTAARLGEPNREGEKNWCQ